MLRILGSPKMFCDGVTRRDMLHVGALSTLGLGLDQYLRTSATQAADVPRPSSFGRAKSCILLFLYGSPSQLEWADMKYDAPLEVRGELGGIRSNLPGCDVCELYPQLAKVMDRFTVVRSMTHRYPLHGVAYAATGIPQIDGSEELNPRDARHWPYIGSVVDYLERNGTPEQRRRAEIPTNIALPWQFSSRRRGEVPRAGPYAAFLGNAYNPLWIEFQGEVTGRMVKRLREQEEEFLEPYVGIAPEGRFELAAATDLGPGMTLDRLDQRRGLLQQFDQERRQFETQAGPQNFDRYREMAYSLIGSQKMQQALQVGLESRALRESYGMTVFGQSALAARRLVEAGSRFVTVFWDEYGLAGSGWDTHWDHYNRMKNELAPGLDRALFGLISDLEQRGQLDETLVMVMSEHGRTPRLNSQRGGGRDHWAQAYTCLFAGGGMGRGRVVGRTDPMGATVTDRPVSPKDILATAYHLLGIDPHTMVQDRQARPLPLTFGSVVNEMLG